MSMWTLDTRARRGINEAYALHRFNPLPVFCDARARVIFRIFNCACISTNIAKYKLQNLVNRLNEVEDKNSMLFERILTNEHDLSFFCE